MLQGLTACDKRVGIKSSTGSCQTSCLLQPDISAAEHAAERDAALNVRELTAAAE